MSKTIMLVTGGTGGHVFPALALTEVLMARGHRVEVMTDTRGERFFSGTNIFPNIIASSSVPGDFKGRAKAALKIIQGIIQSMEYCREYEPNVVVGFGGYPSFPTLFAAQFLKIPTIVHEQNAVFGRANRQVAERVKYIATSFPETKLLNIMHQPKTVHTGNPIRKVFSHALPYLPPGKDEPFQLAIFGGSQGNTLFSDIVPQAIELLSPDLRQNLVITQQCRAEDIDRVTLIYNKIGITARLQTFFNDIPDLYNRAHLIIGRAGASTVAEITAMGRPAVYIPLAVSLDGDQAENARQCVARKAAWMLEEKGFTPDSLAAKLTELMNDPAQLLQAAQSAKTLGAAQAAEKLADLVLQAA
jgi:UDP-N-acetylglucosamine--N-acetylmuramyl-(pentapeptide) pyrophosphoryl-undecaprenol N-acetylglucosamine transferase